MAKFKLLHKPIKRDHSRSLMQQVTNELPPLHTSVGSFSCLLYAMLTTKDENTKSICQQFKRTEKWCNVPVTKTSSTNNKKLSWCWQTRTTHLDRSVKVTKHGTIPYVRYSFLLCNSNFVFKMRHFSDIRLQKMSWPGNRGQRSLKVVLPLDRLRMISY